MALPTHLFFISIAILFFLPPSIPLSTPKTQLNRKSFLLQPLLLLPLPAHAYRQSVKDLSYSFSPPPSFETTAKPLKTHLDEVEFKCETRGYKYGITVDPVRIATLEEFGTPEEVAQRVVNAEKARDGITDVELTKAAAIGGGYGVEYVSNGKRGRKRFVTRIVVSRNLLVVLTAQVKEEEWEARMGEMLEAVGTFEVQ